MFSYEITITKVEALYHGDKHTIVHTCDVIESAILWTRNNPIKKGEWTKYVITVNVGEE